MNGENTPINKSLVGVIILVLVALFGVFFYMQQKPAVVTQLIPVKVGYLPIADAAPLYVAIEKGYFKDEGLDPQLTTMKGGSLILEALQTGDLDLGLTNIVSLLLAKGRGLDFVSLGGVAVNDQNHKEGAILVSAKSNIQSISELKGKKIAINATKNIVELAIRRLLQKNGLSANDIHFVEVPFPQMAGVLKNGEVDAIAVAEPFWTLTVKDTQAKVIAYYLGDVYSEVEVTSWVMTNALAGGNPQFADKLQKILSEATAFLTDPKNESEARSIIAKYTKTDEETAAKMGLPAFKSQLTVDGVNLIVNDMIAEHFLTNTISSDNLIRK